MRVGIKPIVKKRHPQFQAANCRPNTELSVRAAGILWANYARLGESFPPPSALYGMPTIHPKQA
jgi:hypothetical protein